MINVGLLVRLEAKPGKEGEVASFLRQALPLVQEEAGTVAWFAIQFDPSTFGIFDVFANEDDREDHLGGAVGAALAERAEELFARKPVIENIDVLAWKLP